MSNTIGSLIFPNPRVKTFEKEVARAIAKSGFKANNLLVDNDTLLGIEVEAERIHREDGLMELSEDIYLWKNVADNSLRNNGREFVSIPMKGETIEFAIHTLKEHLTKDKTCIAHEYTDRTSIHVHMNALDLTPEQYINTILTYVLVEPILYEYVGGERNKNIFCVPITESNMTSTLGWIVQAYEEGDTSAFVMNLGGWQKYTGLNLLPTRHYGTIEFRHLVGTDDYNMIYGWLNLILSIKKFALSISYEKLKATILEINTTSEYANLMRQIFGDLIMKLPIHDLQMTLENTSIFIKDVYSYNDNLSKVKQTFSSKKFLELQQSTLVEQAKKLKLLVIYDVEYEIKKLEDAKSIYVTDRIPYENLLKGLQEKLKEETISPNDKRTINGNIKTIKSTIEQYDSIIADYDRSIAKLRDIDKEESLKVPQFAQAFANPPAFWENLNAARAINQPPPRARIIPRGNAADVVILDDERDF